MGSPLTITLDVDDVPDYLARSLSRYLREGTGAPPSPLPLDPLLAYLETAPATFTAAELHQGLLQYAQGVKIPPLQSPRLHRYVTDNLDELKRLGWLLERIKTANSRGWRVVARLTPKA